jgi:hypothetical protein
MKTKLQENEANHQDASLIATIEATHKNESQSGLMLALAFMMLPGLEPSRSMVITAARLANH